MRRDFKEAWIRTLMENLGSGLDEATRTQLMESCGRACAQRSSVMRTARSCRGDVASLVKGLAGILGGGCRQEGNVVHLEYPKCYCDMVADGPARLPRVYCCCSAGWIAEAFKTAAQKKVHVETLQSIKRGAAS
jgi:hypothetical protein